jgi:hypothetical protein
VTDIGGIVTGPGVASSVMIEGDPVTKTTYTIADTTASVTLTTWRGKQLEGGPEDYVYMKGVKATTAYPHD